MFVVIGGAHDAEENRQQMDVQEKKQEVKTIHPFFGKSKSNTSKKPKSPQGNVCTHTCNTLNICDC